MANTAKRYGNRIVYTSDGSLNDIDFTDPHGVNLPNGCYVYSIQQHSGTAGKKAKVWDKNWADEAFWDPDIDTIGTGFVEYWPWEFCKILIKGGEVDAGVKLYFIINPADDSVPVVPPNFSSPDAY